MTESNLDLCYFYESGKIKIRPMVSGGFALVSALFFVEFQFSIVPDVAEMCVTPYI